MPTPGKRWRFVTFGTHNAWRPGDERGWRSRGHKLHSSGDYKSPPPLKEHAGLRRWVNERAGTPVIIPLNVRSIIADRIADTLIEMGHRVLAASVSGMHAHVVVELPDNMPLIRAIVGEAKKESSRAVRKQMPGRIWAAGGDYDPIDDRNHLASAMNYVLMKQGPGARTWSYRNAKM
jgi:REP element-mobilizing transposase RayT